MAGKTTYANLQRQFEILALRMEAEREHMAYVIASVFSKEEMAMKLGKYSDSDLKSLMEMVGADIDTYIERFDAAHKEKQKAVNHSPKHVSKQDNAADAAASSAADGANHVSPDTGSVQAKANNVASDNRFVRH